MTTPAPPDPVPAPAPGLVWYVSYGSNLAGQRFGCYLAGQRFGCYLGGGTPDGADIGCHGARDPRPARASVPAVLPGGVFFAGASRVWSGGGVAFFDPTLPGPTAARAYLITVDQFSDVVAQEMGHPLGVDLDLGPVLTTGRHALGPGRYETLLHVGDLDGHPMLTFTAPFTHAEVPLSAPAPAYLAMIGAGLMETHRWSPEQAGSYLATLPGALGHWTAPAVTALLTTALLTTAPQPLATAPTDHPARAGMLGSPTHPAPPHSFRNGPDPVAGDIAARVAG